MLVLVTTVVGLMFFGVPGAITGLAVGFALYDLL